jgi:hypothetical protein
MSGFDRMIDRLVSGPAQWRIRVVSWSAALLLSVSGVGLTLVMRHPLHFIVPATGVFIPSADGTTIAGIHLDVAAQFYPALQAGQLITLPKYPGLVFRLYETPFTPEGARFRVRGSLHDDAMPVAWGAHREIDAAQIIVEERSLFSWLFHHTQS